MIHHSVYTHAILQAMRPDCSEQSPFCRQKIDDGFDAAAAEDKRAKEKAAAARR